MMRVGGKVFGFALSFMVVVVVRCGREINVLVGLVEERRYGMRRKRSKKSSMFNRNIHILKDREIFV